MSPALRNSQPYQPPLMSASKSDAPAAGQFPFFEVLRYFKAFCRDTPEVGTAHRSLFYFFLEVVEHRGRGRFQLNREDGMEGAGIGSKTTYYAALKQMQAWGLITYTPGKNGEKSAIIEVLPNKSAVPKMGHWLGRCRDSDRDADCDAGGTTKRPTTLEPSLPSEGEVALARAEKKIGEQQSELARLEKLVTQLQAQSSASHTGGGAARLAAPPAEPLRVVPPAAEDDPWHARPRDIEMVDEFIANHNSQRVRQHVGKGYLFWAEYESKAVDGTWVLNNGRPVSNWRALILQFGFREPITTQSHANQHRPANSQRNSKAARPQQPPLSEGIQSGQPLTGTIDDL